MHDKINTFQVCKKSIKSILFTRKQSKKISSSFSKANFVFLSANTLILVIKVMFIGLISLKFSYILIIVL